jgi:hypothetical protein
MSDVPRVEATLHAGRLRVRAQAELSTPVVNAAGPKLRSDPVAVEHAQRLYVSIEGSIVRVQAPPPPARGRAPQLLVDVSVPLGTHVTADAGEAQVVATGSLGSLRAHTSSGSVSAETVDGRIDVRTGRGPVTIHDCGGGVVDVSDAVVILRSSRGPLDVRGRSGDVHVWWMSAPATVATSTGNVHLGWAHDRPVHLDIRTEIGRRVITVPDSPSAPDTLSVTSVVGDIKVTPAESRQAGFDRGPRAVGQGIRAVTRRWRRR